MQDNKHNNLVSVEVIAELLNLNPMTVYKWASNKKIPSYKFGHKMLRFDLSEIEQWLETKRQNNGKQ
jgi:excisionase family DNA binding protein